MNVFSKFATIAMDFNGPPGIIHPLLQEKYAWVDQLLCEMYNGYALTSDNCDEYEYAGLLTENYAWVDLALEEMCALPTDKTAYIRYMRPIPLTMGGGNRKGIVLKTIEDSESSISTLSSNKRSRSECDITEYEVEANRVIKRLKTQSPVLGKLHIHLPYVNYDEEWENDSAVSSVSFNETQNITPVYEYESDVESVSAQVWPVDDDSEISCYDIGYDSY